MNTQTIQLFIAAYQSMFHQYGYVAVFALVMVEDFGIPVPGELTLIATSLIASQGGLSIVAVLFLAWLGAVTGDNIGYAIGHFGGVRVLVRYGWRIGLTQARLDRTHAFFERWGGEVVLAARFIEVLRQLNGIIAGSGGMPWPKFLLYNAIGAALWVGAWGLGVYLLGQSFLNYLPVITRVGSLAGAVVVAAAVVFLLAWWWRRRRCRAVGN